MADNSVFNLNLAINMDDLNKIFEQVMPKGTQATGTKNLTPEERQLQQAQREKAKRKRANVRKAKFGTLAGRRLGRVAGNIVRTSVNNRLTAQINDANRLGDSRQAQLLQQQRLRATAMYSQLMSHSTFGLRAVSGILTSKPMGFVESSVFLFNIISHLNNMTTQYNERMRNYHANTIDQYKQTEYMRTRLIYNTFGERGVF